MAPDLDLGRCLAGRADAEAGHKDGPEDRTVPAQRGIADVHSRSTSPIRFFFKDFRGCGRAAHTKATQRIRYPPEPALRQEPSARNPATATTLSASPPITGYLLPAFGKKKRAPQGAFFVDSRLGAAQAVLRCTRCATPGSSEFFSTQCLRPSVVTSHFQNGALSLR